MLYNSIMTIEEAQNNFISLLYNKGIENIYKEQVFFSPDSKRLTYQGNLYASMLKISKEAYTYTLKIPLNQETKKILESNMSSLYFVELASNKYSVPIGYASDEENGINITVYDDTFDIKVQLVGGIEEWWKKVKGEYYA